MSNPMQTTDPFSLSLLYEEIKDLRSKLEFALQFVPCEDGYFTFPDGDSWPAGSKVRKR